MRLCIQGDSISACSIRGELRRSGHAVSCYHPAFTLHVREDEDAPCPIVTGVGGELMHTVADYLCRYTQAGRVILERAEGVAATEVGIRVPCSDEERVAVEVGVVNAFAELTHLEVAPLKPPSKFWARMRRVFVTPLLLLLASTASAVTYEYPEGAWARHVLKSARTLRTLQGSNVAFATAVAPTWPEGSPVPLSVDLAGNLRTSGGGGGGGTSSTFGAAFPATGTAAGFSDGTNMQGGRVFDLDSGAGTQYGLGLNLRKIASGGSVEAGTSTDPLRVDPTGTTTQPISAASLPLPTGAATAALQTQPGVDIGDVTVNNAAGASAVNIQDGGNSITIDGTVSVSGAVDTELPAAAALADGAANPTAPAVGAFGLVWNGTTWDRLFGTTAVGARVNLMAIGGTALTGANVVDGANTAFRVNCVTGCTAGGSFADSSAFTFGTTAVSNTSFVVDDTATNTVAENSAGAARMSTNRILLGALADNAGNVLATATGSPGAADRALEVREVAAVAEDVASASADRFLNAPNTVRSDAPAAAGTTSADGDYQPLKSNKKGGLWVEQIKDQGYSVYTSQTIVASKDHINVFNAAGSGVVLKLRRIEIHPNTTAAVTGGRHFFNITKTSTAGTTCTSITINKMDTNNAAVPAQVTSGTTCTTDPTVSFSMFDCNISGEETAAAFDNECYRYLADTGQPYTLREGEGIMVKQTAYLITSGSGAYGFTVEFTME